MMDDAGGIVGKSHVSHLKPYLSPSPQNEERERGGESAPGGRGAASAGSPPPAARGGAGTAGTRGCVPGPPHPERRRRARSRRTSAPGDAALEGGPVCREGGPGAFAPGAGENQRGSSGRAVASGGAEGPRGRLNSDGERRTSRRGGRPPRAVPGAHPCGREKGGATAERGRPGEGTAGELAPTSGGTAPAQGIVPQPPRGYEGGRQRGRSSRMASAGPAPNYGA